MPRPHNPEGMTDRQQLSRIGKKGGRSNFEKRGRDAYSDMGRMGGGTTLRRYGKEHYSELGRKSAAKRKAQKEQQN